MALMRRSTSKLLSKRTQSGTPVALAISFRDLKSTSSAVIAAALAEPISEHAELLHVIQCAVDDATTLYDEGDVDGAVRTYRLCAARHADSDVRLREALEEDALDHHQQGDVTARFIDDHARPTVLSTVECSRASGSSSVSTEEKKDDGDARASLPDALRTYWRLRRIFDEILVSLLEAVWAAAEASPEDDESANAKLPVFYLYYWDQTHGSAWHGWWITPFHVGCTRYAARAANCDAATPDLCTTWEREAADDHTISAAEADPSSTAAQGSGSAPRRVRRAGSLPASIGTPTSTPPPSAPRRRTLAKTAWPSGRGTSRFTSRTKKKASEAAAAVERIEMRVDNAADGLRVRALHGCAFDGFYQQDLTPANNPRHRGRPVFRRVRRLRQAEADAMDAHIIEDAQKRHRSTMRKRFAFSSPFRKLMAPAKASRSTSV